jgi:hypothetical protein
MKLAGIGQSWVESLKILIPKNLKLFMLASLNAMRRALIPVIVFSIAYGVMFFIGMMAMRFVPHVQIPKFLSFLIAHSLHGAILFWLFGLAWLIRPSVRKTDIHYFFAGIPKMIVVTLIGLVLFFIMVAKSEIIFSTLFPRLNLKATFIFEVILFLLWASIYSLFLFDQKLSIKNVILSLYRSVLFVFYNLPFLILLFGFTIGCVYFILYFYRSSSAMVPPFIWLSQIINLAAPYLVILLIISMLSVFYTKRVHEQYELYF